MKSFDDVTEAMTVAAKEKVKARRDFVLICKVNHDDNAALHFAETAEGAMIDLLDSEMEPNRPNRRLVVDWFNRMTVKPPGQSGSAFEALAIRACMEAIREYRRSK